ncbi:GNAT family N-acetyltransferase [Micromonospora sp. KC207]|uniref:GNAT family N-acetyltransferase n=1 Tax=Micromonospora sp. KC207 TaxID=2530377 RepID=UPI00104CF002|nr:GNAT family N-acetyltransferase [Micromonospora sp. KC207]TDC59540.1 GNAT family N-acetyltransferase [Micromonospora sp. KC207]
MSLTLAPMTAEQLARLRGGLEQSYGEDLAEARGLSPEAARAEAASQIARLLPDGVATPGALLRVALVDGVEVGWIWTALPDADRPGTAWIHNIEVHSAHRGRGHARRMIQLAEAELAGLGVGQLGLNVFGRNTVAKRLYDGLGFRVTAQQMSKPLPPS